MSKAVLDPLLGAVVAGRCHVERRLAAGGMGVVTVRPVDDAVIVLEDAGVPVVPGGLDP